MKERYTEGPRKGQFKPAAEIPPETPLPTYETRTPMTPEQMEKALADMGSGEVLKVVSTDPGSMRDFQAFARQTGNELVEQNTAADEFIHYLRRR